MVNLDGCNLQCKIEPGWTCTGTTCVEICGDGLRVGDEVCDDGNLGGCLANCLGPKSGFDC